MASSDSIRRVLDSFVIERFVALRRGVRVPAGHDLIVGQGATVAGGVVGARSVYVAKAARIDGDVDATLDIVIGAGATVGGNVSAGGDVLLLDGATVHGLVTAKGRARIIGAHVPGGVRAAGDVEVRGESDLSKIQAGGRIRSLPAPVPEGAA